MGQGCERHGARRQDRARRAAAEYGRDRQGLHPRRQEIGERDRSQGPSYRFCPSFLSPFSLPPTHRRAQMAAIKDPENTLIMETTKGRVVIVLRPDLAPKHVERIKTLARENFYDNVAFHRVI